MNTTVVTLDFETYWDNEYSLTKMSAIEYVADKRYETISVSIKFDDHPTDVLFGDAEIKRTFDKLSWNKYALCGHNMSGFDCYIAAYRFGIRPKLWLCTAAMARPIYAKRCGVSLAALAKELGVGVKDNRALTATKGKRLADFTPEERANMETYNKEDTELCRRVFKKLLPHYTTSELWQIDALTRLRTEPQFELDLGLLETAASIERDRKYKSLIDLAQSLGFSWNAEDGDDGLDTSKADDVYEFVRGQLASAAKFAELLAQRGCEVPMKPSPTNPENTVPALAKTDEAFLALQEHPDPVIAAAARARLDVKSTLFETRVQKFIAAAKAAGGRLPIPIKFCGADTTGRDSGEDYNCFLGDTEVLTEQGWVRFDEWKGEPIAQWWPDGSITMEQNPGVLVKPYAGPVVDIESRCVSSTMTPDHRLVSCPPTKSGIREHTAGWVAEHSGLSNIPAAGAWIGVSDSAMTPELVRLAVAFSADGCVDGNTIKVGLRRERKIIRMRELLEAANVPYQIRETPPQKGHKGAHNTVTYVTKNPPVGKGFGPWILRLSREALDAFVSELVHWDGQSHHKSGRLCFWTSQRSEAEWVQTALALSGVVSTIREYPSRNPVQKPKLLVYARKEPRTSIDTARDVTKREYEGLVYCASVESSYILIRRNSKISVVGQCQNLPRINPSSPKPTDALRRSLRAPSGYLVGVVDQSGIELRVNHFLWKVPSSMALYQASPDKADLYKAFAAENLYRVSPDEITKQQRQIGKIAQLGLGFGAGSTTFQRIAKIMGGVDIPLDLPNPPTYWFEDSEGAVRPEFSDEYENWKNTPTCKMIVEAWRAAYPEIVDGWRKCGRSLEHIAAGKEVAVDPWGLVHTCAEGFVLPSGRLIRYPDLREEDDGTWPDGRPKRSWFYGQGRHRARITGPKADENIVQALARDSVFDCSLEFFKRTGLRFALRVHDELVYLFPESRAQELLDELQAVMRTPPKWWPELVVWSEGALAPTYGDAK